MRVKLTGVVGKVGVFHNHSFPCPGAGGNLVAHALTAGVGPSAMTTSCFAPDLIRDGSG